MHDYRVIGLDRHVAQQVRDSHAAPGYGHPAYVAVATGYGPCRVCLRPFVVGEEQRILFTYDPLAGREPFPLPGPIYIHEHDCVSHAEHDRFPDELRFIPLTLNAYAPGRQLIRQLRFDDGQVEAAVDLLFDDPVIAYIHVRNTEAGCFIAQLDRVKGARPIDAAPAARIAQPLAFPYARPDLVIKAVRGVVEEARSRYAP